MSENKILLFVANFEFAKRIKSSPQALEFFKSSFWSISGTIFSKGLVFLSWVIVARLIGKNGYGQFGIIRSTVLMFTTFAGFSLGVTAAKHVAEFIDIDKERTSRVLGLTMITGSLGGVFIGVFFYFLAPWLATSNLKSPEITSELQICSLILFFTALNGAQMGALQGFLEFKKIAFINIIHSIISFPLLIFGAHYFGIYGTIWAFALSYIIICLLSYFALRSVFKLHKVIIDYKNAWKEKAILFSYSLPAFLSGIMVVPIKWIADSFLVSRSGFSEMGMFSAALTINNIILIGSTMLSDPLITIMAKSKNKNPNSKLSRFNIIVPWALGIFVCAPFIIFPESGGFLFGKEYSNKSFELIFIFVLLFTVVLMFKQGLGRIIAVYDLQWWGFIDNLIWGIILISSFLLFKKQNAIFLSMSYFIAYTLNSIFILPVYNLKKMLPFKSIFSLNSIVIWLIVIFISFVGIYIDSILYRFLILFFSFIAFSKLFYNMLILKIES